MSINKVETNLNVKLDSFVKCQIICRVLVKQDDLQRFLNRFMYALLSQRICC
jgi:hypothetical protein